MSLTTLHSNAADKWSIEEDSQGRLWMEVAAGGHGVIVVHYEMNPGEVKEFRMDPERAAAIARRIAARPKLYLNKQTEIAYRTAAGSGI